MVPSIIKEALRHEKHVFLAGQLYCPTTSEYMGAFSTHSGIFNKVKLLKFCGVCGQRIMGLGETMHSSLSGHIVDMIEEKK